MSEYGPRSPFYMDFKLPSQFGLVVEKNISHGKKLLSYYSVGKDVFKDRNLSLHFNSDKTVSF